MAKFEIMEIKEAAWEYGNQKYPGPNGLNRKFIKQFGNLLKDDVKRFLDEFHQNGVLPRGTNSSFITFIPKIDDPLELCDFKPISLVGCMYKILAKILANKLKKKVLGEVIDERQRAFLGVEI